MMKVAIVLRSTEHQPVSTTIGFTAPCVSGLVYGSLRGRSVGGVTAQRSAINIMSCVIVGLHVPSGVVM